MPVYIVTIIPFSPLLFLSFLKWEKKRAWGVEKQAKGERLPSWECAAENTWNFNPRRL
jgi:hypothetical protein